MAASVAASGDGERIYGLTDTFRFRFDRAPAAACPCWATCPSRRRGPAWSASAATAPTMPPAGALFDCARHSDGAVPRPVGPAEVGSHAIDSDRGLIYAQIPAEAGDPPVLTVADADNLTVRERFNLPENLAGKSVLSRRRRHHVLHLGQRPDGAAGGRLGAAAARWSYPPRRCLFRSSFCDRQRSHAGDLGGRTPAADNLDFTVTGEHPGHFGLSLQPASRPPACKCAWTPPPSTTAAAPWKSGSTSQSAQAVNAAPGIRVLVNLRAAGPAGHGGAACPASWWTSWRIPVRNRFFILRQDKNQVLVYDGADYHLIATLRTGNTPTQMAITFDRRYLLVGNDNSQIANVYDLETLEARHADPFPGRALSAVPGRFGTGHPGGRAAWPGPSTPSTAWISTMRTAAELPTLGVWENNDPPEHGAGWRPPTAPRSWRPRPTATCCFTTPPPTRSPSRARTSKSLEGAYAASSYDQFVVDNLLLNSSLVPMAQFRQGRREPPPASPSSDQAGFLTTAVSSASPGVIQRIDLRPRRGLRATRMAEAPLAGEPRTRPSRGRWRRSPAAAPWYRSPLPVSPCWPGTTTPRPRPRASTQVVNAADFTAAGRSRRADLRSSAAQLSPVNLATSEMPLPRALGESCLTGQRRAGADAVRLARTDQRAVAFRGRRQRDAGSAHAGRRQRQLPPSAVRPRAERLPERSGRPAGRASRPLCAPPTTNWSRLPTPSTGATAIVIYLTGMGRTCPRWKRARRPRSIRSRWPP